MALAGFGFGALFQILNTLGSGSQAKSGSELLGEILAVALGVAAICAVIGPKRAARFLEWHGTLF